MDIIICIKRTPDVAEIDLEIEAGGRSIRSDDLVYGINEWDNFAVEEAIRLRDDVGGSVTALTVGGEDDEEVLRRALAMGADRALRLEPSEGLPVDSYLTARILRDAIMDLPFDLILTGAVASDTGAGAVGGLLAAMLDIPQVALATALTVEGSDLTVRHEVERGLERIVGLEMPALVTVQTGINEPRYVSIRGIRKVARVEIPVQRVELDPEEAWMTVDELVVPQRERTAEILEGRPDEIVDKLVARLNEFVGA